MIHFEPSFPLTGRFGLFCQPKNCFQSGGTYSVAEIVPASRSATFTHTVVQYLCLIALLSALCSTGTVTLAHSSEPNSPQGWNNPLQAGINQSGAFLSAGNTVIFLEGVTSQTFQELAYQGILGGLLPGLILGSRPYVNRALQQNFPSPASTIPYNVYTLLTFAGYIPNYLFKALNLTSIYNAGAWYLLPSALYEYIYLVHYASTGTPSREGPNIIRGAGIALGLGLSRLGFAFNGGQSPRQINLAGDDGFQFFIQIRPQFTEVNLTAVEIHRTKLASASESNPLAPMGRLAKVMDEAKINTLFLIPQTTTAGNHLSLSFAAENESGHVQAFTGSIKLDYGDNLFTPWLEPFLYGHTPKSGEPTVYPPLLSVFQKDILKPVIEFLGCLNSETCATGIMEPDSENEKNLTYRPYLNRVTGQTIRDRQLSEEATSLFSIPGNLFLKQESSELTLSSSYTPLKSVKQFWVPSWLTSAAVAEINAAVRESAKGIVHGQLMKFADWRGIDTKAPWERDSERRQRMETEYDLQERDDRYRLNRERTRLQEERREIERERRELTARQEASRESRERQLQESNRLVNQIREIERLQRQNEQELQNHHQLSDRDVLQWLLVDHDIEVNNVINRTNLTDEQVTRFRKIIQESSKWHPGRIMLVKQGMRDEILPDTYRERLEEYRINLRQDATTPVSYAAFNEIRTPHNRHRRVDVDEDYRQNLFAGGVTGNLPKYTEADTACLICFDGPESHPLFGCGKETCSARIHLHCLDEYYRTNKIEKPAQQTQAVPCPQCSHPIEGQSYWF